MKDIDIVDLEKQIMKLRAVGGTDISAAVKAATAMYTTKETERYFCLLHFQTLVLNGCLIREGYSNRIFYLTDLEVGQDDSKKFKESVQLNSGKNLWSTVV